MEKNAARHM